ncbi:hypothetical protein LCGC14_1654490 [marine sediment metagenome]|uniref:Uncharacterized protein n=1 Tax=marine sediment metagenome TaxID=412755 RepID=A0A0F9HWP2_9ZZZZ
MIELYILISGFAVGLVAGHSVGKIETQDKWLCGARIIGISCGAIAMLLLVLFMVDTFTIR